MTAAADGRRVLVVDDEEALTHLVSEYLVREGYGVTLAHDGVAAVRIARDIDPDVVILDLGLPELGGIEVCRQLRSFSDCYVIMLTARADEGDKLIGLSVGADDYVTKPFSPRELVLRVHAMLRRPRVAPAPSPAVEPLRFGALTLDVLAREVHIDGHAIELTRTEFDVLATLATRPNIAFSRSLLIESVWGDAWAGDEHLVDVHIGHLRRKLGDDPEAGCYVRTVRGIGYRMGAGA